MKIHIIIDHPWPESFTHAVLDAFSEGLSEAGHTIDLLDLNQDEFDAVLTPGELAIYASGGSLDPKVKDYQQRLLDADHLAMLFPIWWYVMPARLKGWLDKVLLPGFAFTTDKPPKPLLTHLTGATVLTSSAVTDEDIREKYHSAVDWVLCKGALDFCGIRPVTWLNFGEAGFTTKEAHQAWLDKIRHLRLNL